MAKVGPGEILRQEGGGRAARARRFPRKTQARASAPQEPTERREAFPLGESSSPYGNREQSAGPSVMERPLTWQK